MLQLNPLDPRQPIQAQLACETGPVVLVNVFTVEPADAEQLEAAWAADAAWFKGQPGFISAQLHRGVGGRSAYLNYAVWESTAAFRDAFTHPDFRGHLGGYPDSTTAAPHLFERVAAPGICTA